MTVLSTKATALAQQQKRGGYNKLVSYAQTPTWMRDNEYLRSGYRQQQPTIMSCLRSGLFTLSNDTMNIYTHLLGFLILLPITIYLLKYATSLSSFVPHNLEQIAPCSSASPPSQLLTPITTVNSLVLEGLSKVCISSDLKRGATEEIINLFFESHKKGLFPLLFAGLLCLSMSSIFHTFWVLSPKTMDALVKLDFLGIASLCVGHGMTGMYYTYYCHPPHTSKRFYIIIIVSFLMIVPTIVHPYFSSTKARALRASLFALLASLSLFPVTRALFLISDYLDKVAVYSAVISLATYGLGGVIYVMRFPECCRVGKHDEMFSSHQIMHLLVLFGIAIHLIGIYYLFTFRVMFGCSA